MSVKPSKATELNNAFNVFVGQECPPGPKLFPWYYIINFQKGGSLPFMLALMWYYDVWGTALEVPCLFYAAAHGSYGLAWLTKHRLFPDPQWDRKVTVMGLVNSFLLVLGPYKLAPWLLASGRTPVPSNLRCAVAMIVYVLGLILMIAADCHKSATLKVKKGLITDGPMALCRHPNYLGEMMIYGAFAAMVPHWAPKAVLVYVWTLVFWTNIAMKEARMSRHADWARYCKTTPMIIPSVQTLVCGKRSSE
eukprot:TRINITY_DN50364_c0_g1_i1.p1 TRINITY_DN50364_c0_g1~~TRINITY_DN50364_c0_g1_i1.p1  ORF type:complete len:250 (-),score=30.77 TRINITY_DN50364_c0_g1_i1:8-757(-)